MWIVWCTLCTPLPQQLCLCPCLSSRLGLHLYPQCKNKNVFSLSSCRFRFSLFFGGLLFAHIVLSRSLSLVSSVCSLFLPLSFTHVPQSSLTFFIIPCLLFAVSFLLFPLGLECACVCACRGAWRRRHDQGTTTHSIVDEAHVRGEYEIKT